LVPFFIAGTIVIFTSQWGFLFVYQSIVQHSNFPKLTGKTTFVPIPLIVYDLKVHILPVKW
jgi:hypothetical protein